MPGWFHRKVEAGPVLCKVEKTLRKENLNTVCVGARCPNRGECYSSGTATFMIMGDRCTRNCGFCAVPSGDVSELDPGEPQAIGRAALELGLEHVVITSVTRDDLPNGGAEHFRRAISEIRKVLPEATVEVLVPDFQGNRVSLEIVLEEKPDIFNHNMETVKRLYPDIRPQADYSRSLELISIASEEGVITKSGIMVGLGEEAFEVAALMWDLRGSGCQLLTIGQYLRPGSGNVPVIKYYNPDEFEELKREGLRAGFTEVASGPLVRSSYHAREMLGKVRSGTASEHQKGIVT
ncbi:MAG: lipoyl synthase [Actinobacteria bacterium]|nr:lipoyl synthase [Actinomycetota bacterium]